MSQPVEIQEISLGMPQATDNKTTIRNAFADLARQCIQGYDDAESAMRFYEGINPSLRSDQHFRTYFRLYSTWKASKINLVSNEFIFGRKSFPVVRTSRRACTRRYVETFDKKFTLHRQNDGPNVVGGAEKGVSKQGNEPEPNTTVSMRIHMKQRLGNGRKPKMSC